MRQVDSNCSLIAISNFWKHVTGASVSPEKIVKKIRYINIAEGCLFSCSHCSVSPARTIKVMKLESFDRLAKEIGGALVNTNESLDFCYLGSETDLAVIPGAEKYVQLWFDALPARQKIKIYSHGWIMSKPEQRRSLEALIGLLESRQERLEVFAISVDLYNLYAKINQEGYFQNLTEMLAIISQRLDTEKLKLQIIYPMGRLGIEGPSCIKYYTDLYKSGQALPTWNEACKLLQSSKSPQEKTCAALTESVFSSAIDSGFSFEAVMKISHDNYVPYSAGRATKLYAGKSQHEKGLALKHQERSCLKPLRAKPDEYLGLIIGAAGELQTVSNPGFKLGLKYGSESFGIPYIIAQELQSNVWEVNELY